MGCGCNCNCEYLRLFWTECHIQDTCNNDRVLYYSVCLFYSLIFVLVTCARRLNVPPLVHQRDYRLWDGRPCNCIACLRMLSEPLDLRALSWADLSRRETLWNQSWGTRLQLVNAGKLGPKWTASAGPQMGFWSCRKNKNASKKASDQTKKVTFFSKQRERADVLAFDDQVNQKTKYLRVWFTESHIFPTFIYFF
jgi:hypothetical protein